MMERGRGMMHTAVIMLLAAVLAGPSTLQAGRPDKAGTAAAPELLIPVGARLVGLGGSPLASISGVDALFTNPAGLVRGVSGTSVMVSHMSYLAGIGIESLGAGTALGEAGSLGFSMNALTVGDIAVTTEDQPDGTGEKVSPVFLALGGTFARSISERISVGVTAKLIYEQMGNVSATGFAVDCGVQYQKLGGLDGLSVGVAVKNLGPAIRYGGSGLLRSASVEDVSSGDSQLLIKAASADLPSTIEIGLTYSVPLISDENINISSVFQNNNYSSDEYRFGAEWLFSQRFAFRLGYAFAGETAVSDYVFGPSAGVGFRTEFNSMAISADYAYRATRYFSGNHVISLEFGF
jgi:hypothetical protein